MCPSALPALYFTNCIFLWGCLLLHCFYALCFTPLWKDIWGGIWREALGDNPSRLDQRHPPLPRISLPSWISYKHQQQWFQQQQQSFLDAWGHLNEEALIGKLLESGEFSWHCFLQNFGFIWKPQVYIYSSYFSHIFESHTYSSYSSSVITFPHSCLIAYSPPAFSWTLGILTRGLWRTLALPPLPPSALQVKGFFLYRVFF